MVINKEPDLKMVGSANRAGAACDLVARVCPDVLLLDVSLPDGDGLAVIPQVRQVSDQVQILVLTSLADEHTLLRAIEAGVSGFMGKHRPAAEVLAAIRQAAEGEVVMPAQLLLGLLARQPVAARHPAPAPRPEIEPLTPREQEVLTHTAQGKSSAAIAEELNISLLTVRTHLRNILAKFNVHSRLEAVAFALRHDLIAPPN